MRNEELFIKGNYDRLDQKNVKFILHIVNSFKTDSHIIWPSPALFFAS